MVEERRDGFPRGRMPPVTVMEDGRMARRLTALVLAFASAGSVAAQGPDDGGFLLPPVAARRDVAVPRPEPIPSQDIRPVRADLPEPAPRPARMSRVHTPDGAYATSAPIDTYDRMPKPERRETDPGDLFIRSRKTDRDVDREPARDRDERSRDTRTSLEREPFEDKAPRRSSNRLRDLFEDRGDVLRSDDSFCNMISPITNSSLFEDPRSVTEVRPTFYYQKVPSNQPEFRGGQIWYFGTSARLALTERWSVTLNKLGAVSVNPGGGSAIPSEFGFGEIHIGPKYTFYRSTETETIAAGGVIFQLPFGNSTVFQDTGKLSLVPYVTAATALWQTQLGTINGMAAGGYSFSTNRERSDYLYVSGNLNWDINDRHRLYPLVEAHWFYYTTDGRERLVGFEGRDFANVGGSAKGSNLFTTAFGARYKITERAQIGAAYELPVFGNRDLFRYRFTVDFILRF